MVLEYIFKKSKYHVTLPIPLSKEGVDGYLRGRLIKVREGGYTPIVAVHRGFRSLT